MDLGKVILGIFDHFSENFSLVSKTNQPNLRKRICLKEIEVVLFFKSTANPLLEQIIH